MKALSASMLEVLDNGLLYLYRCDGVYFNYGERVHERNLDKHFQGNWVQFSYKESGISLIMGYDVKGYKIILSHRLLEEDELFDLSIKHA
jgi:hypothetical protein